MSVRDVAAGSSRPSARPSRIYVEPFSTEGAVIKENFARKNRGKLPEEAQQLLAHYIAAEINRLGVPATVVGRAGGTPANAWALSGRFTRIEEGSRVLRMGLGLGLGGTKMETAVQVRTVAGNRPFLNFVTTGGSNATPGAATNPIPFSAAPTALLNSKEGVSDDAARTARMISATLAEYLQERGWIQPGKARTLKKGR
ncbi:MAG TPA: DUF4410 domain-containing protein [Chthoniobacteraceae bacterium]